VAVSDGREKITMPVQSYFRQVIFAQGRYVGVGDLYTANTTQQGGLSPVVWTSPDAIHWSHRVLQLGDGFDPYQESITWGHGRYVATGRMGKLPAVAWTSTDLRHWDAYTIEAPYALAHITSTATGYVAFGSISNGSHNLEKAQQWPALWYSSDGSHWRRTLKLPVSQGNGGFGAVGDVNGVLVAVGTRGKDPIGISDPTAQPVVFLSRDGQEWSEDPNLSFPVGTQLSGAGTFQGTFAFATAPVTPAPGTASGVAQAAGPAIWRASSTKPARRVVVTAGPGLTWDKGEYLADAGLVTISFQGAPGMTLAFDDPAYRKCVLGTDPGARHVCTLNLKPGRYTIADRVPAHRAAGLVATVVVLASTTDGPAR
jgi:hypothetical protein